MKTATLASLCMLAIACAAGAAADDLPPEDRFPDAYRETPLDAPPARSLMELQPEEGPLRTEIQWMREDPARLAEVEADTVSFPAAAPAPEAPITAEAAQAKEEFFTLDELKSEMKKLAWTKGDFKVVPYGSLWGSGIYATERSFPGQYTLYILSPDTDGEDTFVIDTRRTRLGLDVTGPGLSWLGGARTAGKVEIDFHGAFVAENRPGVLLRHAYGEMVNEDWRLLAGQTSDVISPLYPGTISYSVGWAGGNIGYRRAQVRLERFLAFSDTFLTTVQGSLNQNVISDFTGTVDIRPESTGWPVMEGRVGFTLGPRGQGADPITFGVSGHIGEQGFDFLTPGPAPYFLPPRDDLGVRTWSFNVDLRVPLTDRLGVQGEFFTGEDLSTFLGGIVQGVSRHTRRGIRSTGGWGEVWYYWTPRLHSHVGYGLDDPADADVLDGRTYNDFVFANMILDVTKWLNVGVEVSSWETLWAGKRPGESVQFEFTGKFNF